MPIEIIWDVDGVAEEAMSGMSLDGQKKLPHQAVGPILDPL